ncbi:hypothetical protein FRB99_000802 [Tulasnella sp. 403]|nr:hypothetical protein FRB99_000802 [Tulasnella sp. 403]
MSAALFTLLAGNTFYARNIVASVFVMLWATRLAGFLLFRVLKRGSDSRFDDIRANFFKFLGFWVAQIIWVWVVSLPVIILNSPAVSDRRIGGNNPKFGQGADIVGIIFFVVGWITESVADAQKYRYKAARPPKDEPITTGLWKYSRHPPYAGEILLWWGIWILCLTPSRHGNLSSSARSAQWGAIVSPLLTMVLLILASGIPTAEKPTAKRYYLMSYGPDAKPEHANAWANYKEYLNRTSVLWLVSPNLFAKLPRWLKVTVFLELPMYQFHEDTDGAQAIEEAKRKKGGDGAV